jgi:uncharacterized membrane protein YcaP (DUF421 family)
VLHHLFHLGISPAEKAVRTAAVYLGILLLLRVAGKRTAASLNSFDLVVLLLLSNVVQNAIIGNDNSLDGGLLGAVLLLALNYGLVRLTYGHPVLERIFQGTSTTLYRNGHLLDGSLRHELITPEELVAAVRRQGLELHDAETISIEPDGALNVTPKPKPGIEDVLDALKRIEQRLD